MGDIFSGLFLGTLALIFGSAVVGVVISRRRRDRCLAMFDDDHVTLAMVDGRSIWGDLTVFPQGLEMRYDAPYATRLGIIKASYLLFEEELKGLLCLVRYVGNLTPEERARREKQVQIRFRPNAWRRFLRSARNWMNTIRDAFVQAISVFLGQAAKVRPQAQFLKSNQGGVAKLGETLVSAAGHTWEPMLERHLGHRVVIELVSPLDPKATVAELTGYLAEYSDRFLAVFTREQEIGGQFSLEVEDLEREDLRVKLDGDQVSITNTHDTPLVVERLVGAERSLKLDICLTHGVTARLPRVREATRLELARVKRVDLICPRTTARVRYTSLIELPSTASVALAPVHEDRSVNFP